MVNVAHLNCAQLLLFQIKFHVAENNLTRYSLFKLCVNYCVNFFFINMYLDATTIWVTQLVFFFYFNLLTFLKIIIHNLRYYPLVIVCIHLLTFYFHNLDCNLMHFIYSGYRKHLICRSHLKMANTSSFDVANRASKR